MTTVKINYANSNPIKSIEWEFEEETAAALLDVEGDLRLSAGGDLVYIAAADIPAFVKALAALAEGVK